MSADCEVCPFYSPIQVDANWGECRRVAPAADDHEIRVFPTVKEGDWCGEHPLRQRDRLAAMTMQGLLAQDPLVPGGAEPATFLVSTAYRLADAMLAEQIKATR